VSLGGVIPYQSAFGCVSAGSPTLYNSDVLNQPLKPRCSPLALMTNAPKKEDGTCCVKLLEMLNREGKAGNKTHRVNHDDHVDSVSANFEVVHRGDKICVTRTDKAPAIGWKMHLLLACLPK